MRQTLDRWFALGTGLCAALAVGVIALIVAAIVQRGGSAMSWRTTSADSLRIDFMNQPKNHMKRLTNNIDAGCITESHNCP